jgi:hypothetical protein
MTIVKRFFMYKEDTVLVVNGYEIDAKTLLRRTRLEEQRRFNLRKQFGAAADMFLKASSSKEKPEDQAAADLIAEKAFYKAAEHLIPTIPKKLIQQKLVDRNFIYKNAGGLIPMGAISHEGIDLDELKDELESQGLTLHWFDRELQEAVTRHYAEELLAAAAITSSSMVAEEIARTAQRNYLIGILPESAIAGTLVEPTAAQLEQFFTKQQTSKTYWSPEKRSATVWTISPDAYAITISSDEIADEYRRNKQEYAETNAEGKIVYKPLAQVSDAISKKLSATKFRRLFALEAQRAVQDEQARQQLLEKRGAKKDELRMVTRKDTALSGKLFGLKKGESALLLDDAQGGLTGTIITCNDITSAAPLSLAEAKQTVLSDYRLEQKIRKLAEAIDKLGQMPTSKLKSAFEEQGGSLKTVTISNFQDEAAWENKTGQKALPVRSAQLLTKPGQTLYDVGEKEAVLLRLSAVTESNDAVAVKEAKRTTERRHEHALSTGLVASLVEGAKLKHIKPNLHQSAEDF